MQPAGNLIRATYKVREAARIAGCGERAIRNGLASNRIPHLRLGRNILIPRNAFHLWLDSCGENAIGGEKQSDGARS